MNLFDLFNVVTAYKPTRLSKLVKEKTKSSHDKVEQHPFYRKLVTGELDDKKYLIFLFNLLPIYEFIENQLLIPHGYKDLVRSNNILQDIDKYEKLLNYKLSEKDFYNLLWVKQIEAKPPYLLKAHFYVRWLADLYGGQVLKNKVKYNNKYKFKNLRKTIKRAREFIDQSVNDDTVDYFIKEANIAFDMSYMLASIIEKNVK